VGPRPSGPARSRRAPFRALKPGARARRRGARPRASVLDPAHVARLSCADHGAARYLSSLWLLSEKWRKRGGARRSWNEASGEGVAPQARPWTGLRRALHGFEHGVRASVPVTTTSSSSGNCGSMFFDHQNQTTERLRRDTTAGGWCLADALSSAAPLLSKPQWLVRVCKRILAKQAKVTRHQRLNKREEINTAKQ